MIDLGPSRKRRVALPFRQRLRAASLPSCKLRNAQKTNTKGAPSRGLFATTLLSLLGLLAGSGWANEPKQTLAQAGSTTGAPVLPAGPEQQVNPSQTPSTGSSTFDATAAPLFSRKWFDGVKYGAQLEAGFVFNPQRPRDGLNFGHLFTDRANQVTLNQALLTVQRVVDPKATDYDFGFIVQGVFGTDARYLHYLGELDRSINTRYQFAPYQANISAHLPWLTVGGIEAKVGQYAAPLGFEPLDPSTSPFFSHSYISNFGVTGQHTGLLTTTHVNDTFDLWLGIDSGNGTSLGARRGDNNSQPAGVVGFGLNGLLDGKLTVLALSHLGPELPTALVPTADKEMRYYNDIVITYKSSDTLTFTTELNYVRDTGLRAEAYGASQYVAYALNSTVTLNGRAEVWRDNAGVFAVAFPDKLGLAKLVGGDLSGSLFAPPTTYGELTLGVTYKPAAPPPLTVLQVRPELRFDRALNGTRPFNAGRDRSAFTGAVDIVIGF